MPSKVDLEGLTFGRLTVIQFAGTRRTSGGTSIRIWNCQCECGNVKIIDGGSLKTGNTTSCGCFDKERRVKHGMHNTRFYTIWEDMKQRCSNIANLAYERYGGRGIKYCTEWEDFINFKDDMFIGYEDNLTLDRINPNGDYEPSNCQWATKQEQGRNRTMMSTNKTGITGVREWVDKSTNILYYVAEAQGAGKKKAKHFSTAKYGQNEAFKLACEYRERFIEEFSKDGVLFSEYHGKEKN